MPSFAPLPNVDLDPRTEAELVQDAARRVYEASSATLNDFSSGSPIMALLEGQAFAQAEFLQFANQFPEAVLVEWIGPFLGAQRKTGAGSVVEITFEITPREDQFDIFEGFQVSTNPSLTGGESIGFVTTERAIIPAGSSTGKARAISLFRGTNTNVPANTITRIGTSLDGVVSVTNEEASAGGQDPELLSEVKERFFSLIRRRNPVSAEDWQDFFSDALGVGTTTTVLPRRSEKDTYRYGGSYENNIVPGADGRYGGDYIRTNPSVAFFVLNPDGTPITSAQQSALTNLIRWSLPTEFLGFVYPMEVDDVDFVIEMKYDPAKPYAQDRLNFTETVRNSLFSVMTPNAIFPVSYDQQVSDVEGALNTTFPLTLGVTNQYLDPDIASIKAYFPPAGISTTEFNGLSPKPFDREFAVQEDDLILVQGNTLSTFYPALESFNPELDTRAYQVNLGNMSLTVIRDLKPGKYEVGNVVVDSDSGNLHVVLTAFDYNSNRTLETLIVNGYLSEAKTYSSWAGNVNPLDEDGAYDPPIFEFIQGDFGTVTAIPTTPVSLDANKRPGYPVYVPINAFTVPQNTTDLGTAQNEKLISTDKVEVFSLTVGESYSEGEYVKTPLANELVSNEVTGENCYLDPSRGVVEMYLKVEKSFTFSLLEEEQDYKKAVDTLITEGFLKVVEVVPFLDCLNQSTFAQKPFRYQARFAIGEYLRYRPEGGFDSAELEQCQKQQDACANVTDNCRKLLEAKLPLPRYFFALKDFTPNTSDLNKMIEDKLIVEVEAPIFSSDYTAFVSTFKEVTPYAISTALVDSEQIEATTDLTPGQIVSVVGEFGEIRGLYIWESTWSLLAPSLPEYRDMFRFAPGDVASFRNISEIRQYKALKHVTPILDLEVYFDSGVFERANETETVKWFDPNYRLEDIIFQEKNGATSFYRAISSFTPPVTRTVITGATASSSPRTEEIARNLLKVVIAGSCSDPITSRLRDHASTTKLGTLQLDITSKTVGSEKQVFVFESTEVSTQTAPVSYISNTNLQYEPVDYGDGTLAL